MWMSSEFADRREAGRQLAGALARFAGSDALVLALPRGGVPVASEIARALAADLDVLVVRKLGAPGHEELGIGAVVDGDEPQLVVNEEVAAMTGATPGYVRQESHRQLAEVARRKRAYRGDRPEPRVAGRTVIVVDDGIATGGTMKAALKAVRRRGPARLVMAVPVAPPESLAELERECDEIVCLATPEFFPAVGAFYRSFPQTSDDEVVALLAQGERVRPEAKRGPSGDEPEIPR